MITSSNGLHRSRKNSMVFGVAGGLAEYFDIDPTLMRVAWVVLGLASGGTALIAYITLAVIMPTNDSPDVESEGEKSSVPNDESRQIGKGRRRSFLALLLIVVGIVALAANFGLFSWWRWDVLWPLVLIAVGVGILWARYRSKV